MQGNVHFSKLTHRKNTAEHGLAELVAYQDFPDDQVLVSIEGRASLMKLWQNDVLLNFKEVERNLLLSCSKHYKYCYV